MNDSYTHIIDLERVDLADTITGLTDAQLTDALQDIVNGAGGILVSPQDIKHGLWGPLEHELTILAIFGTGPTPEAAARDWARRVLKMAERDSEALAGVAA